MVMAAAVGVDQSRDRTKKDLHYGQYLQVPGDSGHLCKERTPHARRFSIAAIAVL